MNIKECFGLSAKSGDIGVEIEVEGEGTTLFGGLKQWRATHDGSLRDNGIELVLRQPLPYDKIPAALAEIAEQQQAFEIQVKDSGRAGVHVHMNMQKHTPAEVMNFVCAYLIFENLLIDYCGRHRVGNLFCLRASDAEFFVDNIVEAVQRRDLSLMCTDNVRYASLNVNALSRYGSLEFRSMRSTTDPEIVMEWIDVLRAVHSWSQRFSDPIELVQHFSVEGPSGVYNEVFSAESPIVYDEQEMYEGVRQAQLIAYSTENWDIDYYQEAISALSGKEYEEYYLHESLVRVLGSKKKFYSNPAYAKAMVEECLAWLEERNEGANARRRTQRYTVNVAPDIDRATARRAERLLHPAYRVEAVHDDIFVDDFEDEEDI